MQKAERKEQIAVNQNFRKSFWLILLSVMTLIFINNAVADNGGIITFRLPDMNKTYATESLDNNLQLAENFICRKMNVSGGFIITPKGSLGSRLVGTELEVYTLLHNDISAIANGYKSSTVMSYNATAVYEKTEYTADDLGENITILEDGNFTQEALDAINRIIVFDMNKVISALLMDCPYELYWYDKTSGFYVEFPGDISTDGETITFGGNVTVYLRVTAEYSLNGAEYEYNTAYGQGARNAAVAANAIVDRYENVSDQKKIIGYANEICALTSYNYDALNEGVQYGNPWQIIWVFDGNPDTEVVCEGYAKAFQYLCDLTEFTGDISVITVTGIMSGGTGAGRHMWNIVNLEDGNNYLVDVTNIDEGMTGYPDQLLLEHYTSGSYADGYGFITGYGEIFYAYDDETKAQYTEEELTLFNKMNNVVVYGSTEHGQTWFLYDDGLLYVKGTGTLDKDPWGSNFESIKKVVLSEGITEVSGCSNFVEYPELEEIIFPETLTKINVLVCDNPKLRKINIPAGVTQLPMLTRNPLLNNIVLPEGLLTIGDFCFDGCTDLSEINIPTTVNWIGESAFRDCTALQSITISQGIVGRYAFGGCTSLQQVILSEGVESLVEGAFSGCTALTSISLPSTLTHLGLAAFRYCTSLTSSIIIPNTITLIEPSVFEDCPITSVTFPDILTEIGDSAFRHTCISEIILPDSLVSIGINAFRECKNLNNISFGNSLRSIGEDAFAQCGLTTMTLPASVENISFYWKGLSDTLESIVVDENNTHYCDIDGILYNKEKTSLIYCPGGKSGAIIVPDGVTEICEYAFSYCDHLTEIHLPDSVTEIGVWAFELCTNLSMLHLSDSLETVPDYMCFHCYNLQQVDLPNALVTIGAEAFEKCSSLQTLYIPARVSTIGDRAFLDCPNLELIFDVNNPYYLAEEGIVISKDGKTLISGSAFTQATIHVPEGVQTIAGGCFSSNGSIQEVYMPNSVTTIEKGAFQSCINLQNVVFGSGITEIGEEAFEACSSLTQISLPQNAITIGPSAFRCCYSLESFTVAGSLISLGGGAFRECSALTNVIICSVDHYVGGDVFGYSAYYDNESNWSNGMLCVGNWVVATKDLSGKIQIPNGIVGLCDGAFYFSAATEVVCPSSLCYIGDTAFYGCSNLRSIQMNERIEYIGDDAFSGCDLASLTIPGSIKYIGRNFLYAPNQFWIDLVFKGDAPVFNGEAFLNIAPVKVYYPCNNSTWSGIAGQQMSASQVTVNGIYVFDGAYWIAYNSNTNSAFLPDFILPTNLETIEESAFENCSFTAVKLPDGVQQIDTGAFANCTSLQEIYIPQQTRQIADDAFTGCQGLTIVGVKGSYAESYAIEKEFFFMTLEDFKVPMTWYKPY